jgi:predicted Rossmann-fold nucleotide-binding protein
MSGSSGLPESFYCTKPVDFSKPVDTSNVKDKNVIVTGGASGIGAACVKAFAEAGSESYSLARPCPLTHLQCVCDDPRYQRKCRECACRGA